jgi:hypothetical protein
MAFNLTLLRDLQPSQLAHELRQLLVKHSENSISATLLAGVEQGSVPVTVVSLWLSVSKSPVALADALLQSHSVLARRSAIVQFGKTLRSPQWGDIWNHLGGTEGLLSVFAELSVEDVKLLAKAIGRCNKGQKDQEKQEQVTKLLCGLLPSLHSSAPYKSHDERPLHCHYAKMVPACSPGFIRTLLSQKSHPLLGCFSIDGLLQTQYDVVRRLVLNVIFNGGNGPNDLPKYLQSLLQRMPPSPSIEPGLSASMFFSLRLLRELCNHLEDARFSSELFLPGLVGPLMRRAFKKRLGAPILHEIVELAVIYLQHDNDAAQHLSVSCGSFVYYVVRCWSRYPEHMEDSLVTTLGLLQNDSHMGIDQYQDLLRAVQRSQRYTLLQLLVQNTKSLNVNISVKAELRTLRVEKWRCNVFTDMTKDQAVSLLRALILVNPEGSFLSLERGPTILSTPPSPGAAHADPVLLLTLLERGQAAALDRAEKGKNMSMLPRLTWTNGGALRSRRRTKEESIDK